MERVKLRPCCPLATEAVLQNRLSHPEREIEGGGIHTAQTGLQVKKNLRWKINHNNGVHTKILLHIYTSVALEFSCLNNPVYNRNIQNKFWFSVGLINRLKPKLG